jgi:hypothetical protein
LTGGEAGPPPDDGLAPVAPRYGQASLADVMPAVLAALGVAGAGDPLGLSTGALAGVNRVAVLLVDGLGHHLLPLAAPHAPTLADVVAGRLPGATTAAITAGFPSTTPTSLASLGTGAPPGAHGLLGFTVKVPGTLRVLNHIEWLDNPDPLRWQPLRTQFDRAAEAGVTVRVVSRPEFEGSGLTVAAYRGGAYRGAADVDATAAAMLAELTDGDGPTLVYGYHPDVDKTGHLHGVDSPQWREAVAELDRLLTMLVDGLPAGAALVVTADHGQLNVPATHRFDVDGDRRLRSGVWAVAGEPRVRYLHTRRRAVADVVATWQGVLGDAAWVAPREEVVAAGWFGPIGEDHLRRVGDVVVVCRDRYAVLATKSERPTVAKLIAYHGSTTALEMMIPLVVVRG